MTIVLALLVAQATYGALTIWRAPPGALFTFYKVRGPLHAILLIGLLVLVVRRQKVWRWIVVGCVALCALYLVSAGVSLTSFGMRIVRSGGSPSAQILYVVFRLGVRYLASLLVPVLLTVLALRYANRQAPDSETVSPA